MCSFPRVETTVFLLDKFFVDMRVNLRGADVRMSKQLLQNTQVHARFQAVRCKAMAECVRRNLFVQVHRMRLDDFPSAHAAHGFAE